MVQEWAKDIGLRMDKFVYGRRKQPWQGLEGVVVQSPAKCAQAEHEQRARHRLERTPKAWAQWNVFGAVAIIVVEG